MRNFLDQLIQPDQRSAEWHDLRIGRFTSSEHHRLMTPVIIEREMTPGELEARPKKGTGSRTTIFKYEDVEALSKGAITYVKEKVAEQLTGCWNPVIARATEWGEEHEPQARAYLEERTGLTVEDSYFVPFSTMGGGTPDGKIPEINAIIEIKCPYESNNMIDYLLLEDWQGLKELHPDYYCQVQCNILYTKSEKGLFIAYDPRMPENAKMKVITVPPDPVYQKIALIKLESAHKLKQKILTSIINQQPN